MFAFALFLLTLLAPARAEDADSLTEIQKSGTIVWGADQEGGGPFVYPKDDNPEEVTGFEVDLANRLAEYLKVKPSFYQGQWDKLLDLLGAKKVHIVINGYEWEPERADAYEATMPYYVYGLQLMVRADDAQKTSWDALKQPRADGERQVIGVLTGSAAEDVMREFCGDTEGVEGVCDIVSYDGNTDAMREVETGKLDATLQDTPIASFYGPRFPKLKNLGEPVAPGYYVMYVRKGDTALLQAVNEAIILMIRNGDLQRIYTKYGIWDTQQAELEKLADNAKFFGYLKANVAEVEKGEMLSEEEVEQTSARETGVVVFQKYFGILVKSAGMTVLLSLISFPLAIAIGLMVAVGRLYGPVWIRLPLSAYVEFLRGTPLMLQLYFIFFLLPELGINIPAFTTAIIGLAVNYSAYESEIYRAGIQAIPVGQMEAALSLGMSRQQAIFRIIVPQAVRIVIPPVVNDFIALFKDTSVCSVVTIIELTKRFSVLSMSTQAVVEMMLMTCFLYLAMSYPMSIVSRHIERRLGSSPI